LVVVAAGETVFVGSLREPIDGGEHGVESLLLALEIGCRDGPGAVWILDQDDYLGGLS
jgi:hypothetical protein